jgi:MYXO-CTERM domain-containing protein
MRNLRTVAILCAVLLATTTTAWGGLIYTGTLQVPVLSGSPGLAGTGNWVAPSPGTPITTLSWTVSRDSENDPWLYCYDFSTTAQGGLSHIVIEVSVPTEDSPGFTLADVVSGSASASFELGWANSANGNPEIPGPIYGLKFPGSAQTVDQICFESYKEPVWGDFYAKDGAAGGQGINTAWNAGFLDPDPTAPYFADPADMNFHILRPDTRSGGGDDPIPEPASLGLIGVALLATRRRRS